MDTKNRGINKQVQPPPLMATAYAIVEGDESDEYSSRAATSHPASIAGTPSSQPKKLSKVFTDIYNLNSEALIRSISREPIAEAMKDFLKEFTWPIGLQNAFVESCKQIPIRFLIIDDSGSMLTNDGKKLMGKGKATR